MVARARACPRRAPLTRNVAFAVAFETNGTPSATSVSPASALAFIGARDALGVATGVLDAVAVDAGDAAALALAGADADGDAGTEADAASAEDDADAGVGVGTGDCKGGGVGASVEGGGVGGDEAPGRVAVGDGVGGGVGAADVEGCVGGGVGADVPLCANTDAAAAQSSAARSNDIREPAAHESARSLQCTQAATFREML